MSLVENLTLAEAKATTAILAAVAIASLGLLALVVSGASLRRPWRHRMSATELRFRNVFALMDEKRREDLIASTRKKLRCDRDAAMKYVLDQRDLDARSWR
ncbi:hypothetical protein [Arvimicrobium flavum]|uniref:hypothetical protein n=1 Tax=Arvimicrobium flavum TaxID=3393320 RepID=UPI00237B4370|nr:hypothetical protein [Mesorhizobium shangrilense]